MFVYTNIMDTSPVFARGPLWSLVLCGPVVGIGGAGSGVLTGFSLAGAFRTTPGY